MPRASSGTHNGTTWFQFKTNALADPVRIEWSAGSALVLVAQDAARVMLANRWAENLSDELLERYKHEYREWKKANKPPKEEPAAPPAEAPAPVAADPVAPAPATSDNSLADAPPFVPPTPASGSKKAK